MPPSEGSGSKTLEVVLQGEIPDLMSDYTVDIPEGYRPVAAFVNCGNVDYPVYGDCVCQYTEGLGLQASIINKENSLAICIGEVVLKENLFKYNSNITYGGCGQYTIIGYKI